MAISRDGRRLLVSASTARKVHDDRHPQGWDHAQLRVRRPAAREQLLGRRQDDLPRVDRHRLHAHRRPGARRRPRATAGSRSWTTRRSRSRSGSTWARSSRRPGYPDQSSAVRPMALAPDERYVYFQVSFFHGFVEYDLKQDKVLRVARAAGSTAACRASEYLLDSAHHGLAMNPRGTKLCAAGTMSDYARDRQAHGLQATSSSTSARSPTGPRTRRDGRFCFISVVGRRPRLGHLVQARARGRGASRSATTRSACGWAASARRTCASRVRPRACRPARPPARARTRCPRPRGRRA